MLNAPPVTTFRKMPEAERQRRHASGVADEEPHPPEQEAGQPAVRLADEDIFAPGARHHRAQLGVGQRAGHRQQAGDDPHRHHQPRLIDVAGHHPRLEEHARAHDAGDDDGRGRDRAESTNKRGVLEGGRGGAGMGCAIVGGIANP